MAEGTHRRRVTTAPLTEEEIAAALHEIPEEEFIEQFDEIFIRDNIPETLEELITLDDYMEKELREMFQSIIAQYLHPVESALTRLLDGDQTRRTVTEVIEALAPIVAASETLEYEDIAVLLREIQRPLAELRDGSRRKLGKKELAALDKAWDELVAQVMPGALERRIVHPAPGVSLGSLTRYLEGVTGADVRKLRGAGLSTLRELATARVSEIAEVSGLSVQNAERVHAFAVGAVALSVGARPAPRRAAVPPGWMRVTVDSDVLKGRFTFEYGTLGRYLEPLLARLAEADDRDALPASPPRRKAAPKRKPKGAAE